MDPVTVVILVIAGMATGYVACKLDDKRCGLCHHLKSQHYGPQRCIECQCPDFSDKPQKYGEKPSAPKDLKLPKPVAMPRSCLRCEIEFDWRRIEEEE